MTPSQIADLVRSSLPQEGLFAGHDWRVSTEPFKLGEALADQLESLGRVLFQFNKSVNRLYRLSVEGKQPEWVASLLDQGKPASLVEIQRSASMKNEWPRVIRPDLLITDDGLAITELDSVPGGIGLTAWLNQTYSKAGFEVIGGAAGMMQGFESIFGDASKVDIVVSEESSTYSPEMIWLSRQINPERFKVRDQNFSTISEGSSVYRFFELFDAPNVPVSGKLFELAVSNHIQLTPPPKPLYEEKILLALLWNRNLQEFWHRELGEGFFKRMLSLVPRSWVMDPAPLPAHAAIPELNLTNWNQLKQLSQRERDMILKVSGFSPKAWGARGVHLGSDLPQAEWAAAVDDALREFPDSPYILQRYQKPKIVDCKWFDFQTNAEVAMPGRVRLCPYYFIAGKGDEAQAKLGGVLATVCPANKKIIHGMTEAVFAPAMR
jgi:hypothetical protein